MRQMSSRHRYIILPYIPSQRWQGPTLYKPKDLSRVCYMRKRPAFPTIEQQWYPGPLCRILDSIPERSRLLFFFWLYLPSLSVLTGFPRNVTLLLHWELNRYLFLGLHRIRGNKARKSNYLLLQDKITWAKVSLQPNLPDQKAKEISRRSASVLKKSFLHIEAWTLTSWPAGIP